MSEHGNNGYSNRGCRCDVCRAAQAAYMRRYRAQGREGALIVRGRTVLLGITHSASGYSRGCRCGTCTQARAEYRAARKGAA